MCHMLPRFVLASPSMMTACPQRRVCQLAEAGGHSQQLGVHGVLWIGGVWKAWGSKDERRGSWLLPLATPVTAAAAAAFIPAVAAAGSPAACPWCMCWATAAFSSLSDETSTRSITTATAPLDLRSSDAAAPCCTASGKVRRTAWQDGLHSSHVCTAELDKQAAVHCACTQVCAGLHSSCRPALKVSRRPEQLLTYALSVLHGCGCAGHPALPRRHAPFECTQRTADRYM